MTTQVELENRFSQSRTASTGSQLKSGCKSPKKVEVIGDPCMCACSVLT